MRMFRKRKYQYKAFGFSNGFILYGKNSHNKYRIEISPFWLIPIIRIYQGKNKPLIRNINILTFIFLPIYFLILLLLPVIIYSRLLIRGFIDITDSLNSVIFLISLILVFSIVCYYKF